MKDGNCGVEGRGKDIRPGPATPPHSEHSALPATLRKSTASEPQALLSLPGGGFQIASLGVKTKPVDPARVWLELWPLLGHPACWWWSSSESQWGCHPEVGWDLLGRSHVTPQSPGRNSNSASNHISTASAPGNFACRDVQQLPPLVGAVCLSSWGWGLCSTPPRHPTFSA